jgi:hypothetical protein
LVVFAFGVMVLARPASSAAVDFRPVLTFGLYHSGNVQIIGNNPVGDETAAIAVDLAVDRTTANSTFSFYYQASYVGYKDNSSLNYLGNLLGASYTAEMSRRILVDYAKARNAKKRGGLGTSVSPRARPSTRRDSSDSGTHSPTRPAERCARDMRST